MKQKVLTLELVTPGFLGGVPGPAPAEWRATSVRGQLRWWFRAVAGGRLEGDLDSVRKLEAEVFGTTDRCSSLRIRTLGSPRTFPAGMECKYGKPLSAEKIATMWSDHSPDTADRLRLVAGDNEFSVNPIHYLAYGPVDRREYTRSGIPPEEEVRFLLQWRRPPGQEAGELFDLALWAWLNLGGIGSRSRKGFGSLGCREVLLGKSRERDHEAEKRLAPKNPKALGEQLAAMSADLLTGAGTSLPAWSHFSSASQVFLGTKAYGSWQEAMSHLGAWLMAFRRRYGLPADGRVLDGLSLARRDYAWAKNPGAPNAQVPDRAGFGLPLAFRFRNGPESSVVWRVAGSDGKPSEARRASPLLLHVTKFAPGAYCPVLTYLPARLIPQGHRIQLRERSGSDEAPATETMEPTEGQLGIVKRFLADLSRKSLVRKVLP